MLESFPTLHTERLDLVEIEQAHAVDIFKLFGDPKVTRFYNIVTLKEETEAQKIIDWFRDRFADKAGIRWGIALKDQKAIIGTIGFNNFTKGHRANIGFDLQAAFWNKGYVTEALNAVVEFGFRELDINRIEGEVMQGNTASEQLLARAGFTNEGVLRDWMHWNGRHYDMTMFSLLRSEFRHRETGL